ncbi:hypothetical protein HDU93_009845 [Gonapodya sp. JEL0774]|nr:hypothetical protein HDU93_009845 [Gonapodya sp. JEL0774]
MGDALTLRGAKELKIVGVGRVIITDVLCQLSWQIESSQVELAPAGKELFAGYVTASLNLLHKCSDIIGHPNTFAALVNAISRDEKRRSPDNLLAIVEDFLFASMCNIAATLRSLAGAPGVTTILSLASNAGPFSLSGFGDCIANVALRTKELADAAPSAPRVQGENNGGSSAYVRGLLFLENALAFEASQVARIKGRARDDREELKALAE